MAEKFKARAVSFEEKSTQEIEQELLEKHEEKQDDTVKKVELKSPEDAVEQPEATEVVNDEVEQAKKEITDEDVLSHIRNKFGRDDLSYEDLLKEKVIEKELPEDLEALYRYKQETGRGIEDFVKLNRDFSSGDSDAIIAEYISAQNPNFDSDDVAFEMEREFSYDEDLDDELDIKSRKIAKKKKLAEATRFFEEQKEKYKAPLESRDGFIPEEEREAYEHYKKSNEKLSEQKELNRKKSEHFSSKTNDLFSNNFEGFGYKVGDEEIVYKVNDPNSIKDVQSDAMNFINKHLEDGYLKDANAYHKALNAAMDPDALFKFAYEKGAADAITKETKEAKNVDMKARPTGSTTIKSNVKIRSVDNERGNRLVIRKK